MKNIRFFFNLYDTTGFSFPVAPVTEKAELLFSIKNNQGFAVYDLKNKLAPIAFDVPENENSFEIELLIIDKKLKVSSIAVIKNDTYQRLLYLTESVSFLLEVPIGFTKEQRIFVGSAVFFRE